MRSLAIAYGNNRQAKTWVNKTITYGELKDSLKVTIRTSESAEEYAKMKKTDRDLAKDHGGFVAGALAYGRRKVDSVEFRSMLALDGDHVAKDFIVLYESVAPYTSFLYTTHSHTPDNPRVRIVFPLTRNVTPDEFVAVSRYLADMLGIDQFDECSYLPNQLMYWPSTPQNGVYEYKEVEKDWLNPDDILSAHPEWIDPTRLPTSSRESKANQVQKQKVQDPLTKNGVVGLFNRVFNPVTLALEKFLSDIYEPTDNENRWHLIASHSMAGVEIIEDKFVYSHHAKDPAYLKLCNAFDIVRTHKFASLDEKESFKKMSEFAMSLDEVKLQAANERLSEAKDDFVDSEDWKKKLRYTSKGAVLENSLYNAKLIIKHDPLLKGIVFNQLADGLEIKGDVPWQHPAKFWRDADDAQLICYVDDHYGSFSQRNYDIAVTKVSDDRSYHPIRRYFESLPQWDGVKRVDTLFIDYLGAEDNEYIRAVCRKTLCAAYMRIYHPGIKFDYLPVFNGAQGIGKSTFIANLGMEWFSDSLTLSDMNDKTAAEKLQGYWIHEISELAGMKKADLDKVKAFVSRRDDKYRASFGKRVAPHPRQCVFFGTTNSENGYLRDVTGNRRFWNVKVSGNGKYKPWEMTRELVDQIWAETMVISKAGEELFLDKSLEAFAQEEQREAMQQDDREGIVREYLNMLLPDTWDEMDIYRRRDYFRDMEDPTRPKGTIKRMEVSNIEIWCECFGKAKEDIKPIDSYAISAIMKRLKDWQRSDNRRTLPIYGRQRIYTRI
ncbi:Virulence-associated protein E [Gardnerella vaginalis]|uniref:Virulence-associated protein E n=2 Tax=Gardnerella vaginalis TaxID=2702 RepID=A0A135Z9Q5_GARVA|nr:Virulence-associated protein E [Gardnerella vaginalis]